MGPDSVPGSLKVWCVSVTELRKDQGRTARHWHARLSPHRALLNVAGLWLFPDKTAASLMLCDSIGDHT